VFLKLCFFPTERLGRQSIDCVTGSQPESSSEAGIDIALVRLAQGGDTEAFGMLVEQNRNAVYRAVYAALGSRTEADDVVQEAFVTAYKNLRSFRGESSFKTWLLSIAWRKALDHRKRLSQWMRRIVVYDQFADGSPAVLDRVASGELPHDERVANLELQQTVRRLVVRLPRKLRDAVLLAGSGDYSYAQIAEMLRVPVGTVKWRVSEGRRVLREKLAALGHE
jgi:RNA polymerase sigma-70 factor, ECF subfamily